MNNEEYQKRVIKILMDMRTLLESIDLKASEQNLLNKQIVEISTQFQNFILEVTPKQTEEEIELVS